MVSSPQVTSVQSTSSSGSFLRLVKSLPGDLAHSSGLEATLSIARPSLRSARSDALGLAMSHLLASVAVAAVAASPISARGARETDFTIIVLSIL